MSESLVPYFMCHSKKSYSTKKQAEEFIHKAKKAGMIFTGNMRVYKCPFCQKFHLGHSKR